jgi:predicted GNAT superfamily acetyltransferase
LVDRVDGLEVPSKTKIVDEPKVYVRIPNDFSKILISKPELACKWRDETRKVFDVYINKKGYTATGFVSKKDKDNRENYYLLEQKKK